MLGAMTFSSFARSVGLGLAAASVSLSLAVAAAAPVKLVSSIPAKDSKVDWPKQIHLQFSDPVAPTTLVMEMIKPDGSAIPMEAPIASADDKAFTAEVKQPMLAGPYMVMWHGATAKGAPLKGDYTFFVQ
jgi:methionine-rich copper-binding protein CopC